MKCNMLTSWECQSPLVRGVQSRSQYLWYHTRPSNWTYSSEKMTGSIRTTSRPSITYGLHPRKWVHSVAASWWMSTRSRRRHQLQHSPTDPLFSLERVYSNNPWPTVRGVRCQSQLQWRQTRNDSGEQKTRERNQWKKARYSEETKSLEENRSDRWAK